MTLCLAQSLMDNDGAFVAQNQIENYIAWYREGYMSATGECFDIGSATRLALESWQKFFGSRKGTMDEEVLGEGQGLVDKVLKRKVRTLFP